jgi:hypothetical protein
MERQGALVEHDAADEVRMGVGGVDDLLGGGEGDGERFFDQDVATGGEGLLEDGKVLEVGCADEDGIAGAGGEEMLVVRERGGVGELGVGACEAVGVSGAEGGE